MASFYESVNNYFQQFTRRGQNELRNSDGITSIWGLSRAFIVYTGTSRQLQDNGHLNTEHLYLRVALKFPGMADGF